MKFVIVNSFSINMLEHSAVDLQFIPINAQAARNLVINERAESAIGHSDTAVVVANLLGLHEKIEDWKRIASARPTIRMTSDMSLIVAQYHGPRMPEGATQLPEGSHIEFWQVYSA